MREPFRSLDGIVDPFAGSTKPLRKPVLSQHFTPCLSGTISPQRYAQNVHSTVARSQCVLLTSALANSESDVLGFKCSDVAMQRYSYHGIRIAASQSHKGSTRDQLSKLLFGPSVALEIPHTRSSNLRPVSTHMLEYIDICST